MPANGRRDLIRRLKVKEDFKETVLESAGRFIWLTVRTNKRAVVNTAMNRLLA